MSVVDSSYVVPGPRDLIEVTGADAVGYLHSQLSQDIGSLAVGERMLSLVLEPDGRVCAPIGVSRIEDERLILDVDPGYGEAVTARLLRFRLRTDAEFTMTAAERSRDAREEESRIIDGWPALGSEIIPGETLAAETGLTTVAVSFTKGCYPGQELVERMDSRGAIPPRRIVRVVVESGTEVGSPVIRDGAEVGQVTSVAGVNALARVGRAFND
jgi:folate-binding protein YgfZ